ncbi:uncharacterized protein LOC142337896 isoform X2 [Convolutriloba macropyga]|uniref:uncharacterized protein LOC142337896 isoform X2 n=1 Tax=Convolutriloba macropyga TaxID=536237 RepID=UPI003F51DF09
MGKKIRLAPIRFGEDIHDSEPIQETPTADAPRAHLSVLKRIGKPNADVPVVEIGEEKDDATENTATRFMVTVTNERSAQNGDVLNTSSAGRPALRPQSSVQSRLGALSAQNDASAASSIEIIDLEAEPDATSAMTGRQGGQQQFGMLKPIIRKPGGLMGNVRQQGMQKQQPQQQRGDGKILNLTKMTRPNVAPLMSDEALMPNRKRKAPSLGVTREDQRILASLAAPADEEKSPLPGGRRKLFIAGFPKEGCKEAEIKELFEKYGKIEEHWMNMEKGFGFIKLDTKLNAEKAKLELDRSQFKGRTLNVRMASQSSVVKVSNLGEFVTNELLRDAFEAFGDLERVCVACDYHLKPLGYGFVEFANKKRAEAAIRKINENAFVLCRSIKPISVKPLDDNDEEDGLSTKSIRPTQLAAMELSERPRFLEEGTFEYDVALKWKMQYMFEERQREYLEQQLEESRARLELEVEDMYKNHKSWVLREELRRRQEELERLEKFQSGNSMLDSKRAYLDRAAQAREEQFRREEENFMKHQEQLRRNAEVHLVQQMADQPNENYEVPYGGGSARRSGGGLMGRLEAPGLMEMRSGGGGGLLGGMPRDSIEYGAASSVMKARAMGAASGALNQMGGSGGIVSTVPCHKMTEWHFIGNNRK